MNKISDALTPAELEEIEHRRTTARERARQLPQLSDADDAVIVVATLADPDAQPMSSEDLARMRPAHEVVPNLVAQQIRRGRPKLERPKIKQTIRIDPDVLEHFRAAGPGWQSRINEVLRKAAGK